MRLIRIYQPGPYQLGASLPLSDSAFNHLVRVLRLTEGAELLLFDGEGRSAQAQLCQVGKKNASVQLLDWVLEDRESPLPLALAQVVSRGEKMDLTLQKAVELGVQAIVPLTSERCGVRLQGEREDKKWQHWQGIIASACEQCGRNRLPQLAPLQSLDDWLQAPRHGLVLDPHQGQPLRTLPAPTANAEPLYLLVGPEGGLTDAEVALARRQGLAGISLGPRILRTETAGLAALAAIQALWGDF